jgi:hypothetical protein
MVGNSAAANDASGTAAAKAWRRFSIVENPRMLQIDVDV